MIAPKILTVSQVNFYVKSLLDGDAALANVFLSGEISNFTDHYKSGHLYLSLKDANSVISAVMFAGNAARLRFRPQNGMKVLVRGKISLYEATGRYQLYIEDMQPDGVGALALAFEQLKNKLQKKGYFDSAHKKELPAFPQKIALITSPTGAAVEDMKNILRRRLPSVDILMCPVLVQGEQAPEELAAAVYTVDKYNLADLIIIGRGGGSAEDLWAFNDERLAKAVFDCKIPVISAVGHETDFTICDFAADLRAPTPSAAAELALPDRTQLNELLEYKLSQLNLIFGKALSEAEKDLLLRLSKLDQIYTNITAPLSTEPLDNLKNKLTDILSSRLEKEIAETERRQNILASLSPIQTLKRGFAYVTKEAKPVIGVSALNRGERVKLLMQDGSAYAEITYVIKN